MKITSTGQTLNTRQVSAAQQAQREAFSETLAAAQKRGMDDIFREAAEKYNLPLDLLLAVGKAESNFNADAVSRSGAQGVMQLMPGTAKYLGVSDSFDPEQNIMGGAKYLAEMMDKFGGDTELALAAYNAGPGNVKKYDGIPPFKETQNYVVKVMEYAGMGVQAPSAPVGSGTSAVNESAAAQLDYTAPSLYTATASVKDSIESSLREYMLMQILNMQLESGWNKDE